MKYKKVILLTLAILAVTAGCGQNTKETETTSESRQETVRETQPMSETETLALQTEQSEILTEAQATEELVTEPQNTKVLTGGANFTGLSPVETTNHEDGTYFYQDRTEDGLTTITNTSFANLTGIDTNSAYQYGLACVDMLEDPKGPWDIEADQDEDLTAKFGYQVIEVDWKTGQNEDTNKNEGIIIVTDQYTYMYWYSIDIDHYEEMEDVFEDTFSMLNLMEVE